MGIWSFVGMPGGELRFVGMKVGKLEGCEGGSRRSFIAALACVHAPAVGCVLSCRRFETSASWPRFESRPGIHIIFILACGKESDDEGKGTYRPRGVRSVN